MEKHMRPTTREPQLSRDFKWAAKSVLSQQSPRNGILVRLARHDDIPHLKKINVKSIHGLGQDGLLMPMPEAFFDHAVARGMVAILEREGYALGYSVAFPEGMKHSAFFPETRKGRVGLLFGTALDPSIRGQGWQKRLIDLRLQIFQSAKFSEVQCTVSPFNIPSLINLLDSGFRIVALKILLDGHPRFIVVINLCRKKEEPRYPTLRKTARLCKNLSRHRSLLDEGYIGVKIIRKNPVLLVYTKPGNSLE